MSNIYNGVFIRQYSPETPNWDPTGGIWDMTPDIITGGPVILDPSVLLANYNPPPPPAPPPPPVATPFGLNQPNFVYVRGVNTTQAVITVRVWLFWTPTSTCLWPSTWQSQGISVAGQMLNYQPLTVQAAPPWPDHSVRPVPSPPAVTTMPFVVNPTVPLPNGDGFSLITIVDNAPTTPAVAPLPTANPFPNVGALANWVSTSGNVGWLNTTVNTVKPPLTQTTQVTGSGALNVGASATNLPPDATINIECQGPDYANSVNISQLVGGNPNPTLTTPVTWPTGFVTSISITVFMGTTPVPGNASVRPMVMPAG